MKMGHSTRCQVARAGTPPLRNAERLKQLTWVKIYSSPLKTLANDAERKALFHANETFEL